jgi:hypothetical protein
MATARRARFIRESRIAGEKRVLRRTTDKTTDRSLSLTQRDALLITYGDQVREAGSRAFANAGPSSWRTRLHGVVSGAHVLPFYPYSSDDGFSVIDWFAVNPDLGNWSDIGQLGRHFDLMFDGVFNHLSDGKRMV